MYNEGLQNIKTILTEIPSCKIYMLQRSATNIMVLFVPKTGN